MSKNCFKKIFEDFSKKNILVIGDLMLDTYLWGHSDRISPEAPVPIIQVNKIDHTLGGAANVALNLSSLGCKVSVVGLIGSDLEGDTLNKLLDKSNIISSSLVKSKDRPTTVKSRIMSQDQQVLRTDRESTEQLSSKLNSELLNSVVSIIDKVDGVILQDYNKGVLNTDSIINILTIAKKAGKPIYVDPKKNNFELYKGVRFFKPNLSEFRDYYGDYESLEVSGFELKKELDLEILMITRSSEGVSLFVDAEHHHFPTKARHVHDVSGAGDTVIATFALSDLCGASASEAVLISNFSAGRVCEEVGVVPISLLMLKEMLTEPNSF